MRWGALDHRARRGLVRRDRDETLLADLDLGRVATDVGAVLAQHADLARQVRVVPREVVVDVGVLGGDAQGDSLARAADEDGRRARRLRLAHEVLHAHVLAFEGDGLVLGPHAL